MKKKHVILGVTGSIAAYKACELLRLCQKKDWEVSVIMTGAATQFVTKLTFQTLSRRPVLVDMFEELEDWKPTHISLADQADLLLIAPCTANVIAKLAHGIADDALTAIALACGAPLVIAPAMHEKMWEHPATRENVKVLKSRGAVIVDVESGELACGESGKGRLASLDKIISAAEKCLKK